LKSALTTWQLILYPQLCPQEKGIFVDCHRAVGNSHLSLLAPLDFLWKLGNSGHIFECQRVQPILHADVIDSVLPLSTLDDGRIYADPRH